MSTSRGFQNMEMEAPPLYEGPERMGAKAVAVLILVPLALAGAYTTILLLV